MKILHRISAIKRKLRKHNGETLTETLVSVLIISIVSVAFAAMITTASKMNQTAKKYDSTLDTALTKITINTGTSVNVKVSLKDSSTNQEKASETFTGIAIKGDSAMDLYAYTYTVSG